MMHRYKLNVQGKVQGVFFRKNTQLKAIEFSITGWVKNEPDGSVTIEAVGAEKNLKSFMDWCHKGPENAVVENVSIFKYDQVKEYQSFVIER